MDVCFEDNSVFASESDKMATICISLVGRIERDVVVKLEYHDISAIGM